MADKLEQKGMFEFGYGLIPKKVMCMTDLSIEAKAIFAYLMSYSGAGTTSFPSVKTMLMHLGISENRFYKHRKELVDRNIIVVNERYLKGKRTSNLYEINIMLQHLQNEGIEKQHLQNEGIGFEGTIINSTLNNNNILNNNNLKEHPVSKTETKSLSKYEETLSEYRKFRKKIKSPLTEYAEKLMLKKLEKLSGGDENLKIQILEQSIVNGWKGIFELKVNYSNKPSIRQQQDDLFENYKKMLDGEDVQDEEKEPDYIVVT